MHRMAAAEERLRQLEMQDAIAKVQADLDSRNVFTSEFCIVPVDYYERTLEERAMLLKAKSTSQLCKSIVFENVNYKKSNNLAGQSFATEYSDVSNSRYYCVVVQYGAKIDTDLVAKTIINLRKPGNRRLAMSNFNFQLAPESVSDKLTGFIHNGVSPFGMASPLPVIICQRCIEVSPPRVWMGGGHPDVKVCVGATDLVRSLNAIHDYVSHAR